MTMVIINVAVFIVVVSLGYWCGWHEGYKEVHKNTMDAINGIKDILNEKQESSLKELLKHQDQEEKNGSN